MTDGLEAFIRDIELAMDDLTSPEARSTRLAEFAAEQIAEVRASNAAISGRDTAPEVIVDGKKGAPLTAVRPDGVIVANFDLVTQVLEWIGEQLILTSPRLTGRYVKSHVLRADGVEVELGQPIPPAANYEFVNTQPYARKMEPKTFTRYHRDRSGPIGTRRRWKATARTGNGQSDQAPDGVYQAVAALAAQRYGNVAKIRYLSDNVITFNDATGYTHPTIQVDSY